jgi:hypothetical protein
MEWLSAETVRSQRWPSVCCRTGLFQTGFGAEAVYLLNRTPTMAVKQKTPEEAWSGRKLNVSHLKVFGSTAYTQIPTEKRTKLDPKSKKLMITGYKNTHKTYRLVDTDTDKVSFNKDVVDEDVGPCQTSPEFQITEKPKVAKDSGVKLQVAPTKGGGGGDSEHEESPRPVISNPDIGGPSHGGNTDLDEEDPKKRPEWWHNTIVDIRVIAQFVLVNFELDFKILI